MSFELNLSVLQQKLAAGALLILALLPLIISLIATIGDREMHHERVTNLKRQIASFQGTVEHEKGWSASLEKLSRENIPQALLPQENQTALASLLQSRTAAIATRNGAISVQSTAEMQSDGPEPVRYVVSLSFDADIEDIVKVLSEFRTQSPAMVVTRLKIVAHDAQTPLEAGPNILHAEMSIDSFMRLSP